MKQTSKSGGSREQVMHTSAENGKRSVQATSGEAAGTGNVAENGKRSVQATSGEAAGTGNVAENGNRSVQKTRVAVTGPECSADTALEGNFYLEPYSRFSCVGAACPDSCCRGWVVTVDHAAWEKMRAFRSFRLLVRKERNGFHSMRRIFFRCPYLKKGLCSIEAAGRTEMMPRICRMYPRRIVRAGKRTEYMLELSCIHAAELFLQESAPSFYVPPSCRKDFAQGNNCEEAPSFRTFSQEQRESAQDSSRAPSFGMFSMEQRKSAQDNSSAPSFHTFSPGRETEGLMTEADRQNPTSWTLQNEDESYLAFLLASRQKILQRVWNCDAAELICAEEDILSYVRTVHSRIIRDRLSEAESIRMPETRESDMASSHQADTAGSDVARTFFLPLELLNDSIYNAVPYMPQLVKNPNAFRILTAYRRTFGKLSFGGADETAAGWYREMTAVHPDYPEIYRRYFDWCIRVSWLSAYEDYHVLKPTLGALWFTDLLKVFDTAVYIYEKKSGCIVRRNGRRGRRDIRRDRRSVCDQDGMNHAAILSGMERAFRHSFSAFDTFLEMARQYPGLVTEER